MPECCIRTLGEFFVSVDGSTLVPPSTQKARAVLAYLVLNRRRDVSRESLVEVFWPEADPERARGNLKTALWAIRRSLRSGNIDPDAHVDANKSTIRWLGDTRIDLEDFSRDAESREIAAARRALEVYKGEFLEGSFDDWAVSERERAAALYEKALACVLTTDPDIALAQRLIERNPYDESAYSVIIADALRSNRPHVAAAMVDRCRKALADVGAKPSEAFETRFEALRLPRGQTSRAAFPFVGRAAELNAVHVSIERAAQGFGSLTLVRGDAGIGKSALLRVACDTSTERTHALPIHWVRCVPSDPRALGPWPEFAAEIAGQPGGAGHGDGDVSETLASAVVAALKKPAILIIDDAQYLTGDAFKTAAKIIERTAARHAVLVATRPEAVDRLRQAFGLLQHEEIDLECLRRDEVEAGIVQATGAVSTKLAETLYARTDGHPLFLTNIWELSNDTQIDFDRIPAKLQRFLDVRLRSRGPDAHAVATGLAVEPTASAEVLADVLGFTEERTLDAIDDLLALGVIVQPRSGPQFRIRHDLIAEVAAASANRGRLALLHREFARSLEGRIEAGTTLRRARHLRDCGQWLAAEEAYREAASEAIEWRAYEDARRWATEAVDALRTLRRTPKRDIALSSAYRMLASASTFAGDFDAAERAVSESVAHARAAGDAPALLSALCARASLDGQLLGSDADRLLVAEEAAAIAARLCKHDVLGTIHMHRSLALCNLGRIEESLAAADLAESFADDMSSRQIGDFEGITMTRMTAWRFADAARSLARMRKSVAAEDYDVETPYRYMRGYLNILMLAPSEAVKDALRIIDMSLEWQRRQQARDSKGRFGDQLFQSLFTAYHLLGLAYVKMRRWDAAIACAASMYDSAPMFRDLPLYQDLWLLLQIDALLGRSDAGDAQIVREMLGKLRKDFVASNVGLRVHGPFALLEARLAALRSEPAAGVLLESAHTVLAESATGLFVFVDDWFLQLSEAARCASCDDVALRAADRHAFWRARREKAAEGVAIP